MKQAAHLPLLLATIASLGLAACASSQSAGSYERSATRGEIPDSRKLNSMPSLGNSIRALAKASAGSAPPNSSCQTTSASNVTILNL